MASAILSLNAGSSSLKFALFMVGAMRDLERRAAGKIEGIGTAPHLIVRDAVGKVVEEHRWADDHDGSHETYLDPLFERIEALVGSDRLIGVGHRVVHGGSRFAAPIRVTDAVLDDLDQLCMLAPLHQSHSLNAIRAAQRARPGVPHVACFDTSFHAAMPAIATRFALPRSLADEGVRRYGFHGLSYEFIAQQLASIDPDVAAGRVIAAHLGNGASLCAMKDGHSVDTTMGFTALDGLMMGTRCGAIDPGVVLFLLQAKAMSAAAIQHLLYDRSGLLGVSGLSSDMRELSASADPRAREAIDLFVYCMIRKVGALVAVLGGLDGLVFTAGIGENSARVRALVCDRLTWVGVELDGAANAAGAALISAPGSRVVVRVISTDEERMIAVGTLAVVEP